ncbi:MAG: prolyl oligopeptidase family serine peptidase [Ilumatobacteraceae bacterium]
MHDDLAVRLLTTPVVGEPTLRADGRRVAVSLATASLDHDERSTTVHVLDLDGTTRWHSDGPSDRAPRFAPRGGLLGFTSGGTIRLVDVDPDAGTSEASDRTIRIDGGSVRRWAWRSDAAAIVATVARRPIRGPHDPIVVDGLSSKRDGEGWDLDRFDVVVVEVVTGAIRELCSDHRLVGDVGWTSDGDVLVCVPADRDVWRWDLVALDPATGDERWRTAHGPWDRAGAPTGLADGRVLFVGGAAGPGHARLSLTRDGDVADLPTGLDRNVTVGAPAYPGAIPCVDGGDVWFTANDDGCARLYRVPLAGGDAEARSGADEVVTGADVRDGRTAVTVATTDAPSRLRVDGRDVRFGAAATDTTPPWTVERLQVVARDGAAVPAWLLRSRHADDGPAPMLLDIHGGPHNASNGTVGTANLHRVILAQHGWHVLLVNPRGSDGSGAEWYRGLEAHGGWASADLDDLLAAVDAAVAAGAADPERLAVTGYSYGGLATAALTTRTDRFRAAAMGGSLVDLRTFVVTADLGPRLFVREVGGAPWVSTDTDRRSPLRRVDRVRTPTLILHGTADQRCPVTQAEAWFQSLQELGVTSELVLYPGAPHGFVTAGRPSWVLDAGRRIADWILRHTD